MYIGSPGLIFLFRFYVLELIDHIVTNKPDKVADSGVIPCDISDHDLIYIIGHAKLPKMFFM